jgi:hypothetical protein
VERFLVKYADAVIGSLSGFDRLVFRGTLRTLCHRFGVLLGRSIRIIRGHDTC